MSIVVQLVSSAEFEQISAAHGERREFPLPHGSTWASGTLASKRPRGNHE